MSERRRPLLPTRPARAGALLLTLAALACSGSARNGGAARTDGAAPAGSVAEAPRPEAARRDSAGVPIVPILTPYEVLAVFDVLPVTAPRADYSGVTVAASDSHGVTLWLADDKATRLEDAICEVRVDLPQRPRAGVSELLPARVAVRNAAGVPTGDDIEDLGFLPAAPPAPPLLAAVGERGPGDQPVSWFYLLIPDGAGLRLSRSGDASPPGESVGNDGMEGLALRRTADGGVQMFLFKERPAPLYARLYRLVPDSLGYALDPARPDTIFAMPAFQTQSGASSRRFDDGVLVIDRQRRLIGVEYPAAARSGLEPHPREWMNYTAIDSLLEGRDPDTPPSLFGVAEGIAEDAAGNLYVLADNNEVRHSRLVVLRPRR